ncbi:hypothetical protein [Thalassotalea sp. PLHSN55]|uniref:hypothetical protein n=1 Tax=Thalassotalea sp. PLHSN55 TaxID=3435888 RepID=UPI003F86D760
MDRIIFISIALISIVIVLVIGDYLYMGIWYYLAIPVVAYLLSLPFKPQNFFLTGISLAILLSYIPYFYFNITAIRPEGLLGLGHLFSLFGLALGIIFAGFYLKNKSLKPLPTLIMSFGISLSGFLFNQLVVCNTVFYCGKLLSSG